MTNYFWNGSVSTSASTAANWTPSGVPTTGDVIIFDATGTQDCHFDIAPAGTTLTVDEIIIEGTFIHKLVLNAKPIIKGMYIDGTLKAGTASVVEFRHGASPNFFGTYKSYNKRFVLVDDDASYETNAGSITFDMIATTDTKFDDGQHPNVKLTSGNFGSDYVEPTGTLGKFVTPLMQIVSGVFAPVEDATANDRKKHFKFDTFTCTATSFNAGLATIEFVGTSGGFALPVSNSASYGTGGVFDSYYRKIILSATTAGHKVTMEDNTYLSLEELEILDGCYFKGQTSLSAQGCDIRLISPPKIRGTWSFSQITEGIYRSPRWAAGAFPKVNGDFHITGKLTVDGLIDPTGLELVPQASNPGGVTANTIWINSGDNDRLYFGSSHISGGGGGGGGGGTVDVVSNVATNTILGRNDSGSGDSEELTPAEVRTMLNVEDGATADQTGAEIKTAYEAEADTNAFTDVLLTKLNGISTSADVTTDALSGASLTAVTVATDDKVLVQDTSDSDNLKTVTTQAIADLHSHPIQHMRLYLKNKANNALTYTLTSSYTVFDLANTSNWGESTTGTHSDITLVNDTNDHITLAKGGIYQIVCSVEFFPSSGSLRARDMWLVVSTDASSTGQLGTARLQEGSNSGVGNVKLNHTVVHEIATTGSDVDVYFSARSNGNNSNIIAFNDNRTFISITRIGDASV